MLISASMAGKYERVVMDAERALDLRVGYSARMQVGRILGSPEGDTLIQAVKDARAKMHFWDDGMQNVNGVMPIADSHGNRRTLFIRRYSDDQVWLHSKPTSPDHQ